MSEYRIVKSTKREVFGVERKIDYLGIDTFWVQETNPNETIMEFNSKEEAEEYIQSMILRYGEQWEVVE